MLALMKRRTTTTHWLYHSSINRTDGLLLPVLPLMPAILLLLCVFQGGGPVAAPITTPKIASDSRGSADLAEQQTAIRRYAVLMDGFLEIDVPVSWREELQSVGEQVNVTVSFRPATGDDFLVIVTVYPVTDQERVTPPELRRLLEETALPQDRLIAGEKSLTVQQLQGAMGSGYFYYVTDKRLKEGERKLGDYRYLTRGMLSVKDTLLYFSIMTHEKGSSISVLALDMLKRARNAAARPEGASKHPFAQEGTETRHYEIPQDGILKLKVPASWRDYAKREQIGGGRGGIVAITFLPDGGDDFAVEITGMAFRGPSSGEARRQLIEAVAIQAALKISEEKEIESHDVKLSGGIGTYLDYTVKRFKEGERRPGRFRHIREAYLAFNGLVVQVTIGTHDKDSFVRTEVLEMLRNASKEGT